MDETSLALVKGYTPGARGSAVGQVNVEGLGSQLLASGLFRRFTEAIYRFSC